MAVEGLAFTTCSPRPPGTQPLSTAFARSAMSSMISSMPSGPNIPHKIIETTTLLEVEEKRVERLKKKLEISQRECDRLRDQLEMYQNATNPGPITKCPAEVLSMIFKIFIEDNPTHVRSLLLVCRYWYDLVDENPQMWNFIKLKVPEECWDICSWANSASVYITRCLECSQSAALDIELDFEHLQDIGHQLASRLKFGFQEIPSVVEASFDLNLITQWAYGLEFHGLLEYEDLVAECKPDYAIDVIYDLIGPEDIFAERWKTLKVVFPKACETSRVWDSIVGYPFPNLNRVSLKGLWVDPPYDFSFWDDLPVDPQGTPDLVKFPAVEDLELDSTSYETVLPMFPASLHTLSLTARFESKCVNSLKRLTQLRMLKLNVTSKSHFERDEIDINPNLSLPLLQELHIIGDSGDLGPVELDLPSLRLVEIQYIGWRSTAANLPVLKPLQLRSVIDSEDSDSRAKRVLRLLLLHFTGTKDLTVAFQRKEILLDLVQELSREGLLHAAWETLSLHNNEQIVEVIEILGMIGSK